MRTLLYDYKLFSGFFFFNIDVGNYVECNTKFKI